MKKFFVITALTFSVAAHSGDQEVLTGIDLLRAQDEGQTPYQSLEAFFNEAAPLKYTTLPKATDRAAIEKWSCVGADSSASLETMSNLEVVPGRIKYRVVTEAARPAIPGRGPLFPGVPATPEKYVVHEAIAYIRKGTAVDADAIDCHNCLRNKFNVQHEPVFIQQALRDSSDESSLLTATFREKDGYIFFREEGPAYGERPAIDNYYYCWQEPPARRRR